MDDSEAFLLPYLPVLQTCWIPPAQMDRTCEASGIAMHKPEQFSAHTAPTSPLNLGTELSAGTGACANHLQNLSLSQVTNPSQEAPAHKCPWAGLEMKILCSDGFSATIPSSFQAPDSLC